MNEYNENRIFMRNNANHLILQLSFKDVYSIFIALLPVVMIYNVPIMNIGFSTVFLGLFLPYAVFCIIKSLKLLPSIFMIVLWFGYMIIQSKGNAEQIFLLSVILIHVLAAFNSSLNYQLMRKTIEFIGLLCVVLVLIQTIAHYLLGINIIWLIKNLILAENQNVFGLSVGMYRPSAIFLEPSHYVQYCSLAVLSSLFPIDETEGNLKRAIWIAFGCILTTSGMGIALIIGIFGWYALFSRKQKGGKIGGIIGFIIAGIAAYFVLMQFSFFSNAIQRVFGEVDGYNAIWGRTLFWEEYIGSMSGSDLLWGYGTLNLPEGYMTGLMSLIYQYGVAGLILLVVAFISLMFYSRNNFSICCCVIFLVLLIIANLFKFIQMTFWLSLIIAGGAYYLYNKNEVEL